MQTLAPTITDSKYKILLAEDNPGDVRLVEIFLGESATLSNNEIINEATLAGAIKALDERYFDVVLLDFGLLDSSGFETLEKLLAAHPKANVIVFTGLEGDGLGLRALQAGAQDYVVKGSFNSDFLARTISYAIERSRSQQRLEKAKEQYQRIFKQSRDAIYVTTEDGRFKVYNNSTIALFGYEEEEIKVANVHTFYKDSSARKALTEAIKRDGFIRDYNFDIVRKNGDIRNCQVTANLVHTADGEIEYHGIIRDITEQLETERLRQETEIARQRDKMRGQLLTTVSHEMRTPMNIIINIVNLLQETELSEQQQDYIGKVRNSSEHLLKMINDILSLQKIQFDIKLEEENFDLHDMLTHLINLQYSTSKNISIATKIEPNTPRFIFGDKKRVNQILINLVGNALKFTEAGEVAIRAEKLGEEGDKVRLKFEVEDTGIGIPADKVDRVFNPFERVSDENKKIYEGIGLGLSIVKSLVEKMKGEIEVTSELGVGSRFAFTVLVSVGEDKHIEVEPKKVDKVISSPAVSGLDENRVRQILLVEDNKMNQFVAKKHVERMGNTKVTIADNGSIALDKVRENDFDLVLMDIMMPVMDGYEATQHLRQVMNIPPEKLPILAMTAHADIVDDDKYKKSGMQDCIIKPFEPQKLFEKINQYIRK